MTKDELILDRLFMAPLNSKLPWLKPQNIPSEYF